jgi:hypothetical protein
MSLIVDSITYALVIFRPHMPEAATGFGATFLGVLISFWAEHRKSEKK